MPRFDKLDDRTDFCPVGARTNQRAQLRLQRDRCHLEARQAPLAASDARVEVATIHSNDIHTITAIDVARIDHDRVQATYFRLYEQAEPDDPRGSCSKLGSEALHACFKQEAKRLDLKEIVRANKAGCLDHCAQGPSVVVYPEGVWYQVNSEADVTEIMERHIVKGEVVTDSSCPITQLPRSSLRSNRSARHSQGLLWPPTKNGKPTWKRWPS